ncbi:MAG: DUF2853 family protein [Planctomycetes bacterium]|nr:DUF2853 family protein [Planctomycetota bacterium]
MTETIDYATDIKKYTPKVNDAAVKGIVKHLGIALQSKDASLVSASDPTELARVRDSWLKKKLGLTDSDEQLDASVKWAVEKMKDDRSKSRVTVYYLLAEKYGKLGMFNG